MLIFGASVILIVLTVGVVLIYKYVLVKPDNFTATRDSEKTHDLAPVKKVSDARLSSYRPAFFATGLLISVFFSYYVMNYTEVKTYLNIQRLDEILLAEEELVTITDQTPPPPPPPTPEVVVPEIIESPDPIVDTTPIMISQDEEVEPADEVFDFEDDGDDLGVEDISVYDLSQISEMPSFPEGQFDQYIAKNFDYPQRLLEEDADINGLVFVSFIVEKDGSLSNVQVMRGLHKLIDAEAIRVIKSAPKWTPGKNADLPVRVKYVQPIRF